MAALYKTPSAIYSWVGGAWRKDGSAADAGADLAFTPGAGVIIRKAARSSGGMSCWMVAVKVAE